MFDSGFLGTTAPTYMDFITIYFAALPFLLGFAILMAIKKRYDLHYKLQVLTFLVTIIVVVIFEIGVRVSGGFNAFMQESNADYLWMTIFLIVHILVALVSTVLWSVVIYNAYKQYKMHSKPFSRLHKKFGKAVYAGMTFTSVSGIMIYYFLFIYANGQI